MRPQLGSSWLSYVIQIGGLALVDWSVVVATPPHSSSVRVIIIAFLLVLATTCWVIRLIKMAKARTKIIHQGLSWDLYLMVGAGGLLCEASPSSGASLFVFVAIVMSAMRVGMVGALPVMVTGTVGLLISVLIWGHGGVGTLAYLLGFGASALGGSGARDASLRTEQAEVLLAQTQRAHEEELHVARLEESARIAREIHDVLAHTLAGLTIHLESTKVLIERGSDAQVILSRVERAHRLAREGLVEARRAVGVLRGEPGRSTAQAIEALVDDHRITTTAPVSLRIDGDRQRLNGPAGEACLSTIREALTNTLKHAEFAEVSIEIDAGVDNDHEIAVAIVDNGGVARKRREALGKSDEDKAVSSDGALSGSGSGYGLRGLLERAQLLGGQLTAGPFKGGWRVELRLPAPTTQLDVSKMSSDLSEEQ